MNNLLKTISESPLKTSLADADIKLLLSSVSDIRSQDAKAADSFYGSLEGVLLELRTVTADNRDAEAFLKPVSRMDYPDYYELIKHPMDLGTMLKHVKARKYKSKQEFAADLTLIWKNCFKYNTGPDHVLRGCVVRLKRKADHLLAHVSDRPDRIAINGISTPSAAPSSSSSRESPAKPTKINGLVNGTTPGNSMHMLTPDPSTPQADLTPNTPGPSNSRSKSPNSGSWHTSPVKLSPSGPSVVSFEDQSALIRTPAAMALFTELDSEMHQALNCMPDGSNVWPMMGSDVKGKGKETLRRRLRNIIDGGMDIDDADTDCPILDVETSPEADGYLKRKRSLSSQDLRKRPRMAGPLSSPAPIPDTSGSVREELLDSWWQATCSSSLFMGGLPSLHQFGVAGDHIQKINGLLCSSSTVKQKGGRGGNRKRTSSPTNGCKPAKSLLRLINTNIATLSRVRRTHAKLVALNAASDLVNSVVPVPEPASDHEEDGLVLQERGWRICGEVERKAADECLTWMAGKVLQHAGFQGSSTAALSVLTSVASEYLQNVGRTIRFLCDKYSRTMTPEEIILHTLFEGGTAHIQDLERYIKDDIVRYGSRLGDLEKKLVGAYRDVTTVDVLNDEGIFADGDEADHFASGGLADVLGGGEDFLGLRELGIEAEFGLKSLSIPKRLWKGKANAEDRAVPNRESTGEPPLPFPPPSGFIPLEFSKVDSQIGLLRNFYHDRFALLAASSVHQLAISSTFTDHTKLPSTHTATSSSGLPFSSQLLSPSQVLPDDPPNPTRSKIGPLGQVIMSNLSTTANKKKGKTKDPTAMDRTNEKDPEGIYSSPQKESKKKKARNEHGDVTIEAEINPGNAEVNGTGPKKKPKSVGNGKKFVDSAKTSLDVPSVITASA